MQQLKNRSEDREVLINSVEGKGCHYCGGLLSSSLYKGNDAIVCDSCGTPTVQFL